MNLEAHLIHFAQDQIKTMGADGEKYVRRCIAHWKEVYGPDVAKRIAAALNKGNK